MWCGGNGYSYESSGKSTTDCHTAGKYDSNNDRICMDNVSGVMYGVAGKSIPPQNRNKRRRMLAVAMENAVHKIVVLVAFY